VSDAKEPLYQALTTGGIAAFAGVAELVRAARVAGLGVAVASSGSPDKIRHNLTSSGLYDLFEERLVSQHKWCESLVLKADLWSESATARRGVLQLACAQLLSPRLLLTTHFCSTTPVPTQIVSAKHVARGKPAPDVYVEALRRLGCTDARRALVVEDAVNGLLAAHGAGCFTAGVTNSLPARLLAPHADLVVGQLAELLPALPASSREAAIATAVAGMRGAQT
jgi:beta-phosphoglucomutase-like phosphatase (HAD superfamily)